jgi:nicotinate-nucleotide pyrophosphorylase (carboxylating)
VIGEQEQISAQWAAALARAGLPAAGVGSVIAAALAEDLDDGLDLTTEATVPVDHRSVVDFVARAPGVLAGGVVAAAVFDVVGAGRCAVELPMAEGSRVEPGRVVLTVTGPTRDILTSERTALNLLGHLSGVATATSRWVDALAGSAAKVRDTRKTMPGLRALEKYAVRCGGGVNHRMGLFDAALIKDNHVAAAGGVVAAYRAVRSRFPDAAVQVEVDSLEQLREILAAGAASVLLDNFTVEQLREAVAVTDGRAELEASGGLTLESATAVGASGVDFIAVGALTHSAAVLDIGADYRRET